MTETFWDYMLSRHRPSADRFGDFIRLVQKGTIARPTDVNSELDGFLRRESIDFHPGQVVALWNAYCSHLNYRRRMQRVAETVEPLSES